MNMQSRTRFLVITGALIVLSTVIYAVFTFRANTSGQPTTSLATFAFSKTDLSSSGVYAYRPWFENGAWQGDLIQYYVCGMNDEPTCNVGTLKTDAQVGSNPPTATGSNWMARATFAAKESADTLYWQEKTGGRHIFTVSNGSQVNFTWDQLSVAQKLALDSDTSDPNDNFSQGLAPAVATGSAYDSPVLNFIRGDHSLEKSKTGGTYRIRYSLLGDIINSSPVYIGAPTESYTFDNFSTFKTTMAGRSPRLAVGANDGTLHVFDAANGAEVYAYIPSMLIIDPDATLDTNGYPVIGGQMAESKLNRLKVVPYDHTYFVDGELASGSARVGGAWKTVLAGGLGAGAKGLFALDVTYATASGNKVLFEKTGANLGYIYGQPSIARLSDGNWYIVSGNGFGSSNGNARLLLIRLDSPYTMTSIPACGTSGCATGEAPGLAAAALVDTNGDSIVDYAFAGDDHGDMWRFDLANKTAVKIFDGSPDQPITAAPEIGSQPNGGFMVYFGTGTLQHTWSPSGSYPTQAIYGIWDRGPGATIVDQTLASDTPEFDNTGQTIDATACTPPPTDPPPFTVRYMESESSVDFICTANDATCAKGWRVLLNKPGEQVLGSPKLRAGRLTVVTNGPGADLKGDSWLMSLDYLTGGDGNIPVFNANRDTSIDDCDKQTGGKLPVGLGYGTGNVSQHVIARVGPGTDINYINTVQLPVILSNSLVGGHLDVETDSPYGGTTAPNTNSLESEGYNVTTNDGRGRGVDGHFHQYDQANDVMYVDLFQLEPQRGNASFIGKPVAPVSGSCPTGSIPVGNGCLEAVTPELNRAYDTLTDPSAPKPEVYGDSSDNLLAGDKKFIVVVANADLSAGATLQIGCRNWNIRDYQDMLTEQLEANVSPDNLVDYATYADKTSNHPRNSTAGNLVFSLSEIAGERGGTCSDFSPATVRVKFTSRSILDGGVVGTRAQCVVGLHDYRDKVCYSDSQVLANAPDSPFPVGYDNSFSYTSCNDARFASQTARSSDPTLAPPSGYIRDPKFNLHITQSLEGAAGRYRWRNGALTLQFIDVSSFTAGYYCTAAKYNTSCPLQDPNTLPQATSGKKKRFGGTFAKAFRIDKVGGQDVITSIDTSGNGLLYESTIFWHYSDLADNLRRADPASIPCYGDSNYNSALQQELGGLTLGEYNSLIDPLGDPSDPNSLYSKYVTALETLQLALDSGNQGEINQALLELGQLLADNPALQEYARYRDYAPGHVPEQHLLPIDKGLASGGGTPATDVGSGLPQGSESLGPNLKAGRRSWIDLSD
jgi:hypothetical protein